MQTVAVAMIVRDNEDTIGAALDSIVGQVDDIAVVDTGSSDSTAEIAFSRGARVFFFEWSDDFSAARAYAFSKCTADWIMHVDSDDVVEGAEHIRTVINAADSEVNAILWQYITHVDQHGNVTNQNWRERCVRRGSHVWKGRIHEVLVPVRLQKAIRESSVVVHHRPGDKPSHRNMERNVRLLRLQLAEEHEPDSRTLFYLARDLIAMEELDEALLHFEEYLAIATWSEERYIAQILVSYIHRIHRDWDAAIDSDLAAAKVRPTWPHAWFGLAETHYFMEDWEQCIMYSRIGQAMPEPDTCVFFSPRAYQYDWMIYFVVALTRRNQIDEALAITKRALAIVPDDPAHLHNLAELTALTRMKDAVATLNSAAIATES